MSKHESLMFASRTLQRVTVINTAGPLALIRIHDQLQHPNKNLYYYAV